MEIRNSYKKEIQRINWDKCGIDMGRSSLSSNCQPQTQKSYHQQKGRVLGRIRSRVGLFESLGVFERSKD